MWLETKILGEEVVNSKLGIEKPFAMPASIDVTEVCVFFESDIELDGEEMPTTALIMRSGSKVECLLPYETFQDIMSKV